MRGKSGLLLAGLAAGLALSLLSTSAEARLRPADDVLVPGPPALTRAMVERMSAFYSWVLDVQLTEQQLRDVRQDLIDTWTRQDRDAIESNLTVLQLQGQVDRLTGGERALVQQQLQAAVLADLRKAPDDPGARWALGVYEAAHRPIAAGQTPLTRQAADAEAELVLFMASVGLNGEPVVLDPAADRAFKDGFAAALVADYAAGRVDAAEQAEMAKMPLYWAAVRLAWPQLSPADQASYRAQWAQQFAALRPTPDAGGATAAGSATAAGGATAPSAAPAGSTAAQVVSGSPQSLADLQAEARRMSVRSQGLSQWMSGTSAASTMQTCLIPIGFSCYRP